MICTRPTAPMLAIRRGIDRCGNPNARVRNDVPGTKGVIVVLCDDCARERRTMTLIARMHRKRLARLAATLSLGLVVALLGCIPTKPPTVIDAHDVKCIVVRDEQSAGVCVSEAELRTLLPLILADRRARATALAQPGF